MEKIKIDFARVCDRDNGIDMFHLLNGSILKSDDIAQLIYDNPHVRMQFCGYKNGFDIWEVMDLETGCIALVREAVVRPQKAPELVVGLEAITEKWRQALHEVGAFKRQLEII